MVRHLEDDPAVEKVVAIDVRSPLDLADRAGMPVRPLQLLENHPKLSVHNIDLTQPGADRDLTNALEREEADTLCHLAFLSSPTHAQDLAHELETIGTMYVLNAARAVEIPRFVSLSSTMCYGARPDNPAWLTEESPLRGSSRSRFISDRIDAEQQVMRFVEGASKTDTAVARVGAFIGPRSKHFWSRYLSRRVVPTALGYDPLFQVMDVDDAIAGIAALLRSRFKGPMNIVGRGALPLSRVIRGLGRRALPIPATATQSLLSALWGAQLLEMPPVFTDYLQWPWVADGALAEAELEFTAAPIHEVIDRVVRGGGR
jgi:UDP-glucose 4-epimerase